jgi:hypothetical protein
MGFLSGIVKSVAEPQPGVSPEQNLQNLEGSGFLGRALANAFRSGAISKLVEPVSAAQEPAATPSPSPATTNAYAASPQNISIGQTNFRTLPVNMLSRLSLASLKDILSMYDKEGENVPKMADGGEVDRPELIAQLGQIPASAQATVQPVDMPGVVRQVLAASTADRNVKYPFNPDAPPPDSKIADGYELKPRPGTDWAGYNYTDKSLEELGFVPRECGPMGCVGLTVMESYANPKTGEYFTLGTPFQGEMPEDWVRVRGPSYDGQGNLINSGVPKRIYGEVDRIAPNPIAPNPVAPTAPESPYIVNPYRINLGQTQSTPVQPSQPTAQAPQVSRPVYQMPQYQAPPMPAYLQEYVDRTSGNNAPLQSTLMDFLRRQRMV